MKTSRARRGLPLLVSALPLLLFITSCAGPTSTLSRPADPIVTKGAAIPDLLGAAPSDIVAFRSLDGAWSQVPVQVDERADINYGVLYHQAPNNVTINTYTDANTWAGADPDPTFDADDELVVMAKDAGGYPTVFSEPPGVVHDSGTSLRITDPLDSTKIGMVFLYRRAPGSGLDPSAGRSYVTYSFGLQSGGYKATYKLAAGPNPENSRATSAYYTHHFSDRWLGDELRNNAPGSNGVDLLDRNKSLFAPGYCGRSEDTFDEGEGAFIVNKSGPVRAIRAYIGANSGPNTQRLHLFYEQREDIVTDLRVHAIPSILDVFDYSAAVSGMTYANDLNPNGVTIDGVPDAVTAGTMQWEKVDGAGGALVQAHAFSATQGGINPSSYYLDNKTNPTTQCTGDAAAYGQSGPYLNQPLNCTDPAMSCTDSLTSRRSLLFAPPGRTTADAQLLTNQVRQPLATSTLPWRSS